MSKNKILYNTQNISELIKNKSGVIEVDSNVIFTPSAMDLIKAEGIAIVYKNDSKTSCVDNACNNNDVCNDDMIKSITKILISRYNITDEQIIKKIIIEVLNRID